MQDLFVRCKVNRKSDHGNIQVHFEVIANARSSFADEQKVPESVPVRPTGTYRAPAQADMKIAVKPCSDMQCLWKKSSRMYQTSQSLNRSSNASLKCWRWMCTAISQTHESHPVVRMLAIILFFAGCVSQYTDSAHLCARLHTLMQVAVGFTQRLQQGIVHVTHLGDLKEDILHMTFCPIDPCSQLGILILLFS
jgi:hypothetical protein